MTKGTGLYQLGQLGEALEDPERVTRNLFVGLGRWLHSQVQAEALRPVLEFPAKEFAESLSDAPSADFMRLLGAWTDRACLSWNDGLAPQAGLMAAMNDSTGASRVRVLRTIIDAYVNAVSRYAVVHPSPALDTHYFAYVLFSSIVWSFATDVER